MTADRPPVSDEPSTEDAGRWFFHAHGSECDPVCVLERLAKGTWEPAEARATPHEPNHYDWFMPDNPTAAVDVYLDDFEVKLRESLTDEYVHDMAQSVLPLIAAYREARATPPALDVPSVAQLETVLRTSLGIPRGRAAIYIAGQPLDSLTMAQRLHDGLARLTNPPSDSGEPPA